MLYLLFFLSGISGLIYQVVWVREFGNVFGNTIQSASVVVAVFMLGLGVGSYVIGTWADRRYASSPESLLRAYGYVEAVIAALGLAVSLVLPHLGALVAAASSYSSAVNGWHVLTATSYLARGVLALALLAPITVLMGGTLTLLIRYLVRADLAGSGWTIALLYGVNTFGAAAGAFLTDFAFVPDWGLLTTQLIAVALNIAAATGALLLARFTAAGAEVRPTPQRQSPLPVPQSDSVRWITLVLALSGFAVVGIEILWVRHVTLLLGGFRAVFSLVMTILLAGIAAGSLAGGWLERRSQRPARLFMLTQGVLVAAALYGIGSIDAEAISARGDTVIASLAGWSLTRGTLEQLWYDARPMLLEVGLPALLAGFSFPLANALVQRVESQVGHRSGSLYLANTAGAVAGSLVTGYVLLPLLGIQHAATVLALVMAAPIVVLYVASRDRAALIAAGAIAVVALGVWLTLPADYVLQRALVTQQQGERVLAVSDAATELIEVVEISGRGRGLLTNGHAMSSTALFDQRYMRALTHIPLLSMPAPERVLVIGFGVGNSTHAATLHPSVTQVDVADLSRHILDHASYFRDANQDVLSNPKVSVYLNDGRQHLQMTSGPTYDLVTLEPPPIAHAGVSALYSREFYELVRSRLKPGGYISQWLPAYQVPAESSLAMVRAFVDAFPQAVLLSGMQAELLLIGTTGPRIEIDPDKLSDALLARPAVRQDLARLDLGTPREIAGAFVGSSATLTAATRDSAPVTDDRPRQEYGVFSKLGAAEAGVPASLFDLAGISSWCPRCIAGGEPAPAVADLDVYLSLMKEAYGANAAAVAAAATANPGRRVMGSAYLGAVLPDSPQVRALLGLAYLRAGNELLSEQRFAEAAAQLRAAVDMMPASPEAHNDLGVALASSGQIAEASEHFREAVKLDPSSAEAQRNLAAATR